MSAPDEQNATMTGLGHGADADTPDREPLSARARTTIALCAIGATAYVVLGLQYADGHSMDRAGLAGLSGVLGLVSQVLGWPLFLLLQ